jgi:hypothetical protein
MERPMTALSNTSEGTFITASNIRWTPKMGSENQLNSHIRNDNYNQHENQALIREYKENLHPQYNTPSPSTPTFKTSTTSTIAQSSVGSKRKSDIHSPRSVESSIQSYNAHQSRNVFVRETNSISSKVIHNLFLNIINLCLKDAILESWRFKS